MHHDRIAERLEIARTIGLVTDYRITPLGPSRQPQASVTVWCHEGGRQENLASYLKSLLDGLVTEPAIVVATSAAAGAAPPDQALQAAPAPDLEDDGRPWWSAPLERNVVVHGLATAGAMLTCVAVILNIGPFAVAPVRNELPAAAREIPALHAQAPLADTSEGAAGAIVAPVRTGEPALAALTLPTVEPPPAAPVAASPTTAHEDARPEAAAQTVRYDLASAAPATSSHSDHAAADIAKREAIVGVWAPDSGTCSARNFREGVLPTVMNTDGAWAGDTFCMFTRQQQTESGWRMVAKCQNPRERWTSNVRLTVHDNRLTWASRRGTQVYTRCAPDVLMAQAR
jgi:hypothetical protein